MKVNPKVVAITGSNGKTTTKEMTYCVVSAARKTHKSQVNENNQIGVPKTILSMPPDTQALILEMGMQWRGEIDRLAKTGVPDVGVIVNVGVAHLQFHKSLESIIIAKCELLENMPNIGTAIIGQPTEALMKRVNEVFSGKKIVLDDKEIEIISISEEGTTFRIAGSSHDFYVQTLGMAYLRDAWCALTAGRLLGIDDATLARGLREFHTIAGRGARRVAACGALIVDESYNGNPDSVRVAVDSFVDERAFPQTPKFVVLGDLGELGDDSANLHHELGQWIKNKKFDVLVTSGSLSKHIAEGATGSRFEVVSCKDRNEVETFLNKRLTKDSAVLIKGSYYANRLDLLVSKLVSSS